MKKLTLSNVAEGTHAGNITKAAAEVITRKYLLCKLNQTGKVSIAGGTDCPIGVATDEVERVDDLVNVALLGACDTVKMVASETVSAGEIVVVGTGGKVKELPDTAGTYYQVGIALTPANADGIVECVSCLPIKHVISVG
ncbi:MAG: hypothetical protein LBD33_02620 [Puniceicoccales bacterium]|jgi:hypothetical protein|nr:hypothetical protein [Puniceicoccales bacterium]